MSTQTANVRHNTRSRRSRSGARGHPWVLKSPIIAKHAFLAKVMAGAAVLAIAGFARAGIGPSNNREVIYDTMWMIDQETFDEVLEDCIGGYAIYGLDNDSQVSDDFTIPDDTTYQITSVSMGYLCWMGLGEGHHALLEFFADDDDDGKPDETPLYNILVNPGDISVTHFGEIWGLQGEIWRADLTGYGINLPPGKRGRFWVAMQPITCLGWGSGDWYFILRDWEINNGTNPFVRDPGVDPDPCHDGSMGFGPFPGTYGYNDWTDRDPGDVAMKIEGKVAGSEWDGPVMLSEDYTNNEDPRVAARWEYVHAVWRDTTDSGNPLLVYRRSIDGGLTWNPVQVLRTTTWYFEPHIAVFGKNVHVVWSEDGDLWYRRSTDDGKTWKDPVILANDVMFVPDVAACREKVYVVWISDDPEHVFQVQFRRSLDNGVVWDDPLFITEGGALPADLIADSWLDQVSNNQPYGALDHMGVRNVGAGGYESWSIVRFDLSSIPPGTSISSAKLYLYFYNHWDNYPVGPLTAHRVTADWNEATVTWANKPGHDPTATDSANVPGSYGWMEWDVLADVQDFVDGVENNYGWIIKDGYYWPYGGIPFSFFRTKEYGQFVPYLEVEGSQDNHFPRVAGYSDHVYVAWYTEDMPPITAHFTRSTGSGAPGTWATPTTLWSGLYWPNPVSVAAFWSSVYVDHSALVGDPPQGPAQKVCNNWGTAFSNTQWLGNGNDGYPYPEVDVSRAYTANGCTSYLRQQDYDTWDLLCSTAPAGEAYIDTLEGVGCTADIDAVNYGPMHVVCNSVYDEYNIYYGIYYYRNPVASCLQDVNNSNQVDIDDIFDILSAWGPCDDCPEDINEDGYVDIDDLFEVLANWGPCP